MFYVTQFKTHLEIFEPLKIALSFFVTRKVTSKLGKYFWIDGGRARGLLRREGLGWSGLAVRISPASALLVLEIVNERVMKRRWILKGLSDERLWGSFSIAPSGENWMKTILVLQKREGSLATSAPLPPVFRSIYSELWKGGMREQRQREQERDGRWGG